MTRENEIKEMAQDISEAQVADKMSPESLAAWLYDVKGYRLISDLPELTDREMQECAVRCFSTYPKDPYKLGKEIVETYKAKIREQQEAL